MSLENFCLKYIVNMPNSIYCTLKSETEDVRWLFKEGILKK